jgi:hypothetical protein
MQCTECEQILDSLSIRQHLRPHEPLEQSLARLSNGIGVCPGAVNQAVRWLQLDPARPIGRLRRTELMQLSRSIHRFWRQPTEVAETPA